MDISENTMEVKREKCQPRLGSLREDFWDCGPCAELGRWYLKDIKKDKGSVESELS